MAFINYTNRTLYMGIDNRTEDYVRDGNGFEAFLCMRRVNVEYSFKFQNPLVDKNLFQHNLLYTNVHCKLVIHLNVMKQ